MKINLISAITALLIVAAIVFIVMSFIYYTLYALIGAGLLLWYFFFVGIRSYLKNN